MYSNCHGPIIKKMFMKHNFTKNKFNINIIRNYDNLNKSKIDSGHISLLKNCDIFIYQPFNKYYNHSEYDISGVKKYLKKECIIKRVNYYRCNGFWYNHDYVPYKEAFGYSFHAIDKGIYKEIEKLTNKTNKEDITNFIDNVNIDKDKIKEFFNSEMERLKIFDERSDVKMYDFFKSNYQKKRLFFDRFHPTNTFFYEIFRQLVKQICNYELSNEDDNFIKNEIGLGLTHFTVPIIPFIKKTLDIKFSNNIYVFHPEVHPKQLYMNVYDYYYIRLSPDNFKKYLIEHG